MTITIDKGKPTLDVIDGAAERDVLTITAGYSKRRENKSTCLYHRVLVDESKRIVECSVCGTDLDPVHELAVLARYPDRWRQMIDEKKALRKEIEALQKDVERLKSAKRRARDGLIGPAGRVVDAVRKQSHPKFRGEPCTCDACRALRSLDEAIASAAEG